MITLILGLIVLLGTHSVRLFAEDWRRRFIEQRGRNTWRLLYSALSLLGLVLVIYGYGQTRLQPVIIWNPPAGMAHLAALLTLVAFILLAASGVPGNRLRARVGHPMVLGVKVWAVAHLLANGRLGDIVLFGAFLIWAIADFAISRRRDRQAAAAAGSAGTPPVQTSLSRDVITVLIGLGAWLVFAFWLHRALIGVSPFS